MSNDSVRRLVEYIRWMQKFGSGLTPDGIAKMGRTFSLTQ